MPARSFPSRRSARCPSRARGSRASPMCAATSTAWSISPPSSADQGSPCASRPACCSSARAFASAARSWWTARSGCATPRSCSHARATRRGRPGSGPNIPMRKAGRGKNWTCRAWFSSRNFSTWESDRARMDKNCVRRLLIALAVLLPQYAAAENGVTKDKIVLGQSVALTGPAAQLGIQMRNGARAYLDYVNTQGGVHGRKIELITLDDGYEPARSLPNTRKLIEEHKVFALIGYVGTPTSVPAIPVFTEAKVPFFGPFSGAEALRVPFNRYIFHVRASYYDETDKIVEQGSRTAARATACSSRETASARAAPRGPQSRR